MTILGYISNPALPHILRHSVEDITASSHADKLIRWGSDIQDNFSMFVPTLIILWQHTCISILGH